MQMSICVLGALEGSVIERNIILLAMRSVRPCYQLVLLEKRSVKP